MVVGEFTQETNLVVIGGGPGGYTAAFRAAELGIETLIVDTRETLGGAYLHQGGVASKALLHLVETIGLAERAGDFGLRFAEPDIDLEQVRRRRRETIDGLAGGLDELCRTHGIERVQGEARFEDSRRIVVRSGPNRRLRFRRAVIATGSQPLEPGDWMIDSPRVLDAAEALRLEDVPATLLVLGSGAMAVELASIYAALGSEVTLADRSERLLPNADADLVGPLAERLTATLAGIRLGAEVRQMREAGDGVEVDLTDDGARQSFERVVVAVGQRPRTDELGLAATKVRLDEDGFVKVDERLQTTDPRIFAVGDVTGEPMLAHKAMRQGRVCAEVIAGWGSVFDPRAVPIVIFTDPQIAWCGLTETQAEARGIQCRVNTTGWSGDVPIGAPPGPGRREGITKVIYDPDTQLILGVGVTGPHAGELIAEGALALEMGAVVTDLASTIHPHSTLSELIGKAAGQAEETASPAQE